MPTSPWPQRASRFFYYDEHGKRRCADLHDAIVEDNDHERARDATRRMFKEDGWTDEEIEWLMNASPPGIA
jgi:hypothetical protein